MDAASCGFEVMALYEAGLCRRLERFRFDEAAMDLRAKGIPCVDVAKERSLTMESALSRTRSTDGWILVKNAHEHGKPEYDHNKVGSNPYSPQTYLGFAFAHLTGQNVGLVKITDAGSAKPVGSVRHGVTTKGYTSTCQSYKLEELGGS